MAKRQEISLQGGEDSDCLGRCGEEKGERGTQSSIASPEFGCLVADHFWLVDLQYYCV